MNEKLIAVVIRALINPSHMGRIEKVPSGPCRKTVGISLLLTTPKCPKVALNRDKVLVVYNNFTCVFMSQTMANYSAENWSTGNTNGDNPGTQG